MRDFEKENELLKQKIKDLQYEIRMLKLRYAKCGDCMNADLYVPAYTYPFFDPKCKIHKKTIKHDGNDCEDFKMFNNDFSEEDLYKQSIRNGGYKKYCKAKDLRGE